MWYSGILCSIECWSGKYHHDICSIIKYYVVLRSIRNFTNAHPARQDDPGQHEQVDYVASQVAPHPVPQRFHYPYRFVSSLLKNSKGDEILYPVNDDRDRQWARRLDWVVERHLDRAEDELEELRADYVDILSRSQRASERRFDQEHIADLYTQLETANRLFRDSRR